MRGLDPCTQSASRGVEQSSTVREERRNLRSVGFILYTVRLPCVQSCYCALYLPPRVALSSEQVQSSGSRS